MCWFVTVAVSAAHRAVIERASHARHDLVFAWPVSTPTADAFPLGSCCVEVTHGWCSCDLYSAPRASSDEELERERARLTRKGWSQSKVERALQSKAESAARPTKSRTSRAAFHDFLAAVTREAGEAVVFAHFYSGNQHTEAIGSPPAAFISLPALAEDGFPPDTIVTVREAG